MLSPGNPYALPSTLVAAGAYLAATILTDASILVRIGILVLLAGVVPVVLNRIFGGSIGEAATEETATEENETEETATDETATEGSVEEPPEA